MNHTTQMLAGGVVFGAMMLAGCKAEIQHKVDPIEVKPIHITMDVNLRVDRKLDDFFDFQDQMRVPPPRTQPAPTP